MPINPVMEAIKGYKIVDDIFRQKRLDEEGLQERALQRERQTRQDEMQQKLYERQEADWKRIDDTRYLQGIAAKLKTGAAPSPTEVQRVNELTGGYLDAVAALHNDIPAAIKGDKEATARLVDHINVLDSERFTKGGTRYGRPIAIYPAKDVPGGFYLEGEFAEFKKGKNGEILTGKDGRPIIDESTRRRAPLTEGKSSDPNDPVKVYTLNGVMPKILQKAKALEGIRAKLVEFGDQAAAKEIEDTSRATAAATHLKALAKTQTNPSDRTKLNIVASMLESGDMSVEEASGAMKLSDAITSLSDREKLDIQHQYREDEISARGAESRSTALYRHGLKGGGGSGGGRKSSGGGGEAAETPSGYQVFYTQKDPTKPPLREVVPVGSKAWHDYRRMGPDKAVPVADKGQGLSGLTENQALNKLAAYNPPGVMNVSEETHKDGMPQKISYKAKRPVEPAATAKAAPAKKAQPVPQKKRNSTVSDLEKEFGIPPRR